MSQSAPAPAIDPNDNNAYLVYIPSAVFFVVSPVLVALRTWARLRNGGTLGADDWTAIAALIFALLTSAFLVTSCHYGMGRHWVTIQGHDRFETNKYFYMAQVTYKGAINLVKCCILLLYLRLFHVVRWFRYSCWALLTAVAMYCTASIAATIFQCRPLIRALDKDTPGTCIDTAQFWFANAGFSIATDVIILLLPMPLVWRLGVPLAQKLALMAVFTVGIFAVITSCLRVTTLDIFAKSPDNTYNVANVMWTIVEPNVAIVCACLPVLRPLLVKLVPGLRSANSKTSGDGYGCGYGYGSSSQSQSRRPAYATAGSSRSRGAAALGGGESRRRDWVELAGVKAQGEHLASARRPGSLAGSEESILAGTQTVTTQAQREVVDGSGMGIQKTVEYSIQYSRQQ